MSGSNGRPLEFKASREPVLVGQLFHLEGLSVTAKVTCRCSHKNEALEIPQSYVGRCRSCRRGYRNHGLQTVNGQMGCAIEPLPPDTADRPSGRGRGLLRWTPEIVLEMIKGGRPIRLEVTEHPIPRDAALIHVTASDALLTIEIDSAELPVGESPALLPSPALRIVDSDAKIVHDAGRLRAALVKARDELNLMARELDRHEPGDPEPPWELTQLLAETASYELPELALKGGNDV